MVREGVILRVIPRHMDGEVQLFDVVVTDENGARTAVLLQSPGEVLKLVDSFVYGEDQNLTGKAQ